MSASRFVCTTDLRRRPSTLLREITSSGEPCYVTQNGQARAVIVDINRYHALMDLIEDSESLKQREFAEENRQCASIRSILSETGLDSKQVTV